MPLSLRAALVAALCVAGAAGAASAAPAAGVKWQALTPGSGIWPGGGFGLHVDPVGGGATLLSGGGFYSNVVAVSLWDPTRGQWTRIGAGAGDPWPSDRFPATALDTRRRVVDIFGGFLGSSIITSPTPLNELWTWSLDDRRWTEQVPAPGSRAPPGLGMAAMAYDQGRDVLVVFGGQLSQGGDATDSVWEWSPAAATWLEKANPGAAATWPPAQWGGEMIYDPARARTILVGRGTVDLSSWEWDGETWTRYDPPTGFDPARAWPDWTHLCALVFDGARGRVLRTGIGASPASAQRLWVWQPDQGGWVPMVSSAPPFPAEFGFADYDERRDRLMLWGGFWGMASNDTLLEYDPGADAWTDRTPSPWPIEASGAAAVYDRRRQRVVVFGGRRATDFDEVATTFEWDGATAAWQDRTPAAPPRDWPFARHGASLVYDSVHDRPLLYGGTAAGTPINDLASWDGDTGTWTPTTHDATSIWPVASSAQAAAFDDARGVLVLFQSNGPVSTGSTWEWSARTAVWTDRSPAVSPPSRSGHSMYYDSARGLVVMFGGDVVDAQQLHHDAADLWEWDGAAGAWSRRSPDGASPQGTAAPSGWPPARRNHAMAYDPVRGAGVLVDGLRANDQRHLDEFLNDLWQWDGAEFTSLPTEPVDGVWPQPREQAALAFDADRKTLVLYGGNIGLGTLPFTSFARSPVWEASDDSSSTVGPPSTTMPTGSAGSPGSSALAPRRGCACDQTGASPGVLAALALSIASAFAARRPPRSRRKSSG